MKKKVFRERYALTEDKKAGTIEIPKIETNKPTKRGKKNVKSNK